LRRFASGDFVRHGLLVFVATTLINALGYAYHFAISRKIGVVQYGVLASLNAAFMLSLVVPQIVGTVVVKYAAEFRAAGDRAHLAVLARRLIGYGGAAALAITLLGIASAGAVARFLKIGNVTAVALALVVMGISTLTPSLRALFQGIEDFRTFAVSSVLESLLKAVFGIGLVYAGFGVDGAFGGWALGSFVALLYTAAVLGGRYRSVPPGSLFIDFRRLWITMANVSAAIALLATLSYADVIVVKHYADPTTAGLYGALALAGKILFFFVGFVPAVTLPKATRLALAGRSPVGVFRQAFGLVAVISAAGLVAYGLFPRPIITGLAGPSFAPATPYVFSYGCAMVLLAVLNVVVVYKIGIHRFDFIAPLALCVAAELTGIAFFHRSLPDVIEVLIVVNGVGLLTSCYRVTSPARSPLAVQPSDAAA
jgi:O-antigen/teichoic acid export membrane protein